MIAASMPSQSDIIQGLEFISMKYRRLAIIQHIALLLLVLGYWGYRERISWGVSLYFFLTSVLVGTLALVEANNLVTCAVFGIMAILFLAEMISPEMDYSTKRMKRHNLIVALIAGCYALWYPYPMSGDYFYALIASPFGILPTPTLLVVLAFLLVSLPKTNRKLHGFVTISSFYYGLMGAMRLEIYWDIPLAVFAFYSLVMLNLTRDRTKIIR